MELSGHIPEAALGVEVFDGFERCEPVGIFLEKTEKETQKTLENSKKTIKSVARTRDHRADWDLSPKKSWFGDAKKIYWGYLRPIFGQGNHAGIAFFFHVGRQVALSLHGNHVLQRLIEANQKEDLENKTING